MERKQIRDVRERIKAEEDIKVMYVSLCGVDVITSISRMAANVAAITQTGRARAL